MKTRDRYGVLAAILLCSVIEARADKVLFGEDFNRYKEGEFVAAVAAEAAPYPIIVGNPTSTAAIVSGDRTQKTTRHLELRAGLKGGEFNVAGFGWRPSKQPRVRKRDEGDAEDKRVSRRDETLKDLANYTLVFEFAVVEGPGFEQGGLGLDVILIGDDTGTCLRLTPDVTGVKTGAGLQKIAISLEHGQQHLDAGMLDPTDSRFRIEFNTVGIVPASTTQKIAIDNIELVRGK